MLLVGAGLVTVITGRETNPYTGRSQLLMTSGSEEMQIGARAYSQVKNDPSSGSRKIHGTSNRSSGSRLGL